VKSNKTSLVQGSRKAIKLSELKRPTSQVLLFSICLFVMLVATELPAKGEVDYLKKMGVTRLNETFDAPAFLLPDLEGKKISLHKFQGKFVMLNFWATW
jgi:hypothetical protein